MTMYKKPGHRDGKKSSCVHIKALNLSTNSIVSLKFMPVENFKRDRYSLRPLNKGPQFFNHIYKILKSKSITDLNSDTYVTAPSFSSGSRLIAGCEEDSPRTSLIPNSSSPNFTKIDQQISNLCQYLSALQSSNEEHLDMCHYVSIICKLQNIRESFRNLKMIPPSSDGISKSEEVETIHYYDQPAPERASINSRIRKERAKQMKEQAMYEQMESTNSEVECTCCKCAEKRKYNNQVTEMTQKKPDNAVFIPYVVVPKETNNNCKQSNSRSVLLELEKNLYEIKISPKVGGYYRHRDESLQPKECVYPQMTKDFIKNTCPWLDDKYGMDDPSENTCTQAAPEPENQQQQCNGQSAPQPERQQRQCNGQSAPQPERQQQQCNRQSAPQPERQQRQCNGQSAPQPERQQRDCNYEPAPQPEIETCECNCQSAPPPEQQQRDCNYEPAPQPERQQRESSRQQRECNCQTDPQPDREQRESCRQQRESSRQQRECNCQTDPQPDREQRESCRQQRESERQQRESERQQRESERQQRESERQQRESERQQRESSRQQRECNCQTDPQPEREQRESSRQQRDSNRQQRDSKRRQRDSNSKKGNCFSQILSKIINDSSSNNPMDNQGDDLTVTTSQTDIEVVNNVINYTSPAEFAKCPKEENPISKTEATINGSKEKSSKELKSVIGCDDLPTIETDMTDVTESQECGCKDKNGSDKRNSQAPPKAEEKKVEEKPCVPELPPIKECEKPKPKEIACKCEEKPPPCKEEKKEPPPCKEEKKEPPPCKEEKKEPPPKKVEKNCSAPKRLDFKNDCGFNAPKIKPPGKCEKPLPEIKICKIKKPKKCKNGKETCKKDKHIIDENLAEEIKKIASKHHSTVFIKVVAMEDSLYHIQLSTVKNDFLGCLFATETAFLEAKNSNGFEGYITLCIARSSSFLHEVKLMVDFPFEMVDR